MIEEEETPNLSLRNLDFFEFNEKEYHQKELIFNIQPKEKFINFSKTFPFSQPCEVVGGWGWCGCILR